MTRLHYSKALRMNSPLGAAVDELSAGAAWTMATKIMLTNKNDTEKFILCIVIVFGVCRRIIICSY